MNGEIETVFRISQAAASLAEQLQAAKTWHQAVDVALNLQLRVQASQILQVKGFEVDNIVAHGKAVERIRTFIKKKVKNQDLDLEKIWVSQLQPLLLSQLLHKLRV